MTAPKKPVHMACVRIEFIELLMPADKAMKVVELLQSAFVCNREYGERNYKYHIGDQPAVDLSLVKPGQIVAPAKATPTKLLGSGS